MANFNGQPNFIEADRLDHWMAGLFGIAIAVSPISPVAMGLFLLPAIFILMARVIREYGFNSVIRGLKSPVGVILSILFCWFIFTSFFSIKPDKSFQIIFRTIFIIAISYCFYQYCRNRKGLASIAIWSSFTFYSLWAAFASYCHYINPDLLIEFGKMIGRDFQMYNFFKNDAALAVFYIPLAFYLGWKKRGGYLLIMAVSSISIAGLITNGVPESGGNRSALVGGIIAFGCVIFFSYLKNRNQIVRKATLAMILTVGCMTFVGLMAKLPKIEILGNPVPEKTLAIPDHHRQIIWSFVYDVAKDHPILGVGIDSISRIKDANMRVEFPKIVQDSDGSPYRTIMLPGEYVPSHPHNWILEIASETGVVGIALTLLALMIFLLEIMKLGRKESVNKGAIMVAFYMFAGFWVSSLSNFSIWSAWWLISFFLMMAMILALAQEESTKAKEKPKV